MTIMEILEQIRPDADFASCDDFVEAQLLDSFEFIELVEALEEAFEIEIGGRDIVPENFTSIEAIENLIRKSGGKIG